MMTYIEIAIMVLLFITSFGNIALVFVFLEYRKRTKESEYYTDYVKGKLVMRVYKYEFEFQAVKDIPRGKLLDQGDLNASYRWVLYET